MDSWFSLSRGNRIYPNMKFQIKHITILKRKTTQTQQQNSSSTSCKDKDLLGKSDHVIYLQIYLKRNIFVFFYHQLDFDIYAHGTMSKPTRVRQKYLRCAGAQSHTDWTILTIFLKDLSGKLK